MNGFRVLPGTFEYDWDQTAWLSFTEPIRCGFCGITTSARNGFESSRTEVSEEHGVVTRAFAAIRICDTCRRPNFCEYEVEDVYNQEDGAPPTLMYQSPASAVGRNLRHLPKTVENLWNQIRACMRVGSWSPATMAMRSLIAAVAVAQGASADKNFKFYVEYLKDENLVGAGLKELVDLVRTAGNEVAHELRDIPEKEARLLFTLCEHLLLDTYVLKGDVVAIRAKTEH